VKAFFAAASGFSVAGVLIDSLPGCCIPDPPMPGLPPGI
jgi:hypothetical protein